MVFNFALSEHCDAAYTQALKFCRQHSIATPTTQFQFSKAVAIPQLRTPTLTKVPVADVNVPVIGGHAGVTILPLFSQATPSANLNAGVISKEENVATNVIGNSCSLSSNNALNDHPNGQVENKFCGNASFTADTTQGQHDRYKPSWTFPKGAYRNWKTSVSCSITVGMLAEIVVMYPIQRRKYRNRIDNLLVLLIGGIPIAMPTVLFVNMAIGSHRLFQQGAITKRMTAIEEMVGMDVLCSDKTGTLTLHKLSVDKNLIEVFEKGLDKEHVMLLAARASRIENQDAKIFASPTTTDTCNHQQHPATLSTFCIN
ncbi:hypothetical protein KIW84_053049 [Lathyrus oleraceus]|uniref:Uncharacterized protein n=1 Tax=Pisum sativum TaxID=3888 RepID=A0A9D4WS31_PEA|nr:hypothetical protein KIW84_053049 [Pisum sativum]